MFVLLFVFTSFASQATVVIDIDFAEELDPSQKAVIKQGVYKILVKETASASIERKSQKGYNLDQELGANPKEQTEIITKRIKESYPDLTFSTNIISTTLWDLSVIKNFLINKNFENTLKRFMHNNSYELAADLYYHVSKDTSQALSSYDHNADSQILTQAFLEPIFNMFKGEGRDQEFESFEASFERYSPKCWFTYLETQKTKNEWEKKRQELKDRYSPQNNPNELLDILDERYQDALEEFYTQDLNKRLRHLTNELNQEISEWSVCDLTFTILKGLFKEYRQLEEGQPSLLSKCVEIELQALRNNQIAFFRATPGLEVEISPDQTLSVLDSPFWINKGIPSFDKTAEISFASSILAGAIRDNSGLSACTYQFYRAKPDKRMVYAITLNREDLYTGRYSQFFHLPIAEKREKTPPLMNCEGIWSKGELFHPRKRGLRNDEYVSKEIRKELREQRGFSQKEITKFTRKNQVSFKSKAYSSYLPSTSMRMSFQEVVKDYGLVANEIFENALILTASGERLVDDADPLQIEFRKAQIALREFVNKAQTK